MAAVVVHRAHRKSEPESVEADLGALWRELAGRDPVARAVMSNLIVFRQRESVADSAAANEADASDARAAGDDTLDTVMARHPSRTIVLDHDLRNRGAATVEADVSVSVFGDPPASYAVEAILVRSTCPEVSLPSIVRRFIRGDLPTSVWWTEDLSRVEPLNALVVMGRQLLFDSRRWNDVAAGIRALAPIVARGRVDLADVNWCRLSPFRQALVHAVAPTDTQISSRQVQIARAPDEDALAWLLAGWLAAKLEWPATDPWPAFGDAREGELLTLTVDTGSVQLRVSMNDHRVRVEQEGVAPQVTPVPCDDPAEAIAAELRSLARDTPFHETLVALIARVVQS